LSLSAPKLKKPKPPPAPPSLGDPQALKVGRFMRLACKRSGYAGTIKGGREIGRTGAEPTTVGPKLG
jgi:hypothetical protein